MSATGEPREVTGIRDGNYNLLWYAGQCLLRLQNHLYTAERDRNRAHT